MLKKIAGLLALCVCCAWLNPALADKPNYAPEFPENSGTYDVPGHPNLKVKVFVHYPKATKPAPSPVPDPTPITCTNASVYNAIVDPAGWHLPKTVVYYVNPSSAPTYVSNLPLIAQDAFAEWTSNLSGKVTMVSGGTTNITQAIYDRKNIIAWGTTSKSALAVTYTWYDKNTKQVSETDTIMNKQYLWTSDMCHANSYDAQDILTHELGHWFGLNDEYASSYADNTMYGYGTKAEIKKTSLENGDIIGLWNIYSKL